MNDTYFGCCLCHRREVYLYLGRGLETRDHNCDSTALNCFVGVEHNDRNLHPRTIRLLLDDS